MAGPWEKYQKRPPASPIGPFPGMLRQGNIDLAHRPVVNNPDGSISTVRSMSYGNDDGEVLVPTVSPDGRIISDQEAMGLARKTGQNLGVFDTPAHADMYAQALHKAQGQFYAQPAPAAAPAAPWLKYQAAPQPEGPALTAGGQQPTVSYDDAAKELSGITQNPARAAYNDLPGWQKPIVAADDIVRLFTDGATFGWGDKAVAAARAPFTDKDYAQELRDQRRQTNAATARAGGAGTAAEFAGAIATPTKVLRAPLAGKGALGAIAEGAGYGGLDAAGRDNSILAGTAAGAAAGLGGHVVGDLLSGAANKLESVVGKVTGKIPARMSVDELHTLGEAAARRADDAGVVVSQNGTQKLVKQFEDIMADHGAIPENEPGVFGAWKRLKSMADTGDVTLKGIYSVRKTLGNAFNPQNRSQNALASRLTNAMDDFIDKLAAGSGNGESRAVAAGAAPDVVAGDAKVAAESLKEMRNLWHRMRKLERVEDLVDKAGLRAKSTGIGGNEDNATRQNIRRLLDNEKLGRGYTGDEMDAMRDAVIGTSGQNALRTIGKLSPTSGTLTGGTGAAAGSYIGSVLGGPVGGAMGTVAVPLVGLGAKTAADAITQRNVSKLMDLIAAGGNKAAVSPPNMATGDAMRAAATPLGRALMAAGVNSFGR